MLYIVIALCFSPGPVMEADLAKGHFDYAKYAQLLQLARFFQVPKLANWIENKGFERAITTTTHMENCPVDGLIRGDMQEQSMFSLSCRSTISRKAD